MSKNKKRNADSPLVALVRAAEDAGLRVEVSVQPSASKPAPFTAMRSSGLGRAVVEPTGTGGTSVRTAKVGALRGLGRSARHANMDDSGRLQAGGQKHDSDTGQADSPYDTSYSQDHVIDVGRLRPFDYAEARNGSAEGRESSTPSVVLDYSRYEALMAADDLLYEDDGTPLCTETQMSARFGQDWRDTADEDVSDDDIERHLARADSRRRAAVRAADPYAWHDDNHQPVR